MSIPKKIHYCWFGGNPMPKLLVRCIASWKAFCPDYEIICWNETNVDFSSEENRYLREAYEAGKWAFVTDVVRLQVIERYGGVYFDTDVELLRPIDTLLEENHAWIGLDEKGIPATGLGFAAEPHHPLIQILLESYKGASFILSDGSYDTTPCTKRTALCLQKLGMKLSNTDQIFMETRFYPSEYFCPMALDALKPKITPNTYSIHHYAASWVSPAAKRTLFLKRLIGSKLYDKMYGKFLYKLGGFLEW